MHARACTHTNIFKLCICTHMYIQFKVSENGYLLNNDSQSVGVFCKSVLALSKVIFLNMFLKYDRHLKYNRYPGEKECLK